MNTIFITEFIPYDSDGMVVVDKEAFFNRIKKGYMAERSSFKVSFCETGVILSVEINSIPQGAGTYTVGERNNPHRF
jgi:hypothetical protein